jgi:sulfatase modifying factor 1
MRKACGVTAVVMLLCLGIAAQATIIETVPVGDPGNMGEWSGSGAGGYGPDRICGSVGYNYRIGKYEVTAAQYTDFLNHKAPSDPKGLYNSLMWTDTYGCKIQRSGPSGNYTYSVAPDWANRPVNYIGYWDACRFANWLHNGQGNGVMETGAYTLIGYMGSDGRAIQRNPGARWFVPSEDEWYKAAYYKGGGINAGYWEYPTKSNSVPANQVLNVDPGNSANYYWNGARYQYSIGSPYYRTNVGEFENSASAYGTFDQGGNVREWNETIVFQGSDRISRGIRGGGFVAYVAQVSALHASNRGDIYPTSEFDDSGFRVAEAVPEPSGLVALAMGIPALTLVFRRRCR